MPRNKTYVKTDATRAAMRRFWSHGFNGSPIGTLVDATGVSRHGLYGTYSDKAGLFAAATDLYRDEVVTPAFAAVEAEGATVSDIRRYLIEQIEMAEREGLPGPGCLIVNTMTETGPHDPAVAAIVDAHLERVRKGLANALPRTLSDRERVRAAWFLCTAIQGLWAVSRTTPEPTPLYAFVDTLLAPYEGDC